MKNLTNILLWQQIPYKRMMKVQQGTKGRYGAMCKYQGMKRKKKTGKRAKQTDIHQESPVPNEYELQRLERIMRNKERLVALGLDMSKENTHLPKQDKNKIKVSAEC